MTSIDLVIDSRDKDSSSTSTNFSVSFTSFYTDIERVRLRYVGIGLTNFNISSANNVVSFNENSTNKSCTITSGIYTGMCVFIIMKNTIVNANYSYRNLVGIGA